MSNHNDIMCEVEIDSNIVEVVDNETFSEMGVVAYDHYEVREMGVGDDDQYEEVTCENDDSQGLLLQNIDDGKQVHLNLQQFIRPFWFLLLKENKSNFVFFSSFDLMMLINW